MPHGSKLLSVISTKSFAMNVYVVISGTRRDSPSSSWNVTIAVATLLLPSATLGSLTLRCQYPLSETGTAPKTAPNELNAASVPSRMCAPPTMMLTVRLAVVAPMTTLSAHDCCGVASEARRA